MSRLTSLVAERVKEARQRAGLSQEDVARRAHMSSAYISRLERGVVPNPKTTDLVRVARALKMTLEELTGGDEAAIEASDEDEETFDDLVRRIRKRTGQRDVSIGLARVATDWNRISPSDRKMIEAAVEAALEDVSDSPGGDEESPE